MWQPVNVNDLCAVGGESNIQLPHVYTLSFMIFCLVLLIYFV